MKENAIITEFKGKFKKDGSIDYRDLSSHYTASLYFRPSKIVDTDLGKYIFEGPRGNGAQADMLYSQIRASLNLETPIHFFTSQGESVMLVRDVLPGENTYRGINSISEYFKYKRKPCFSQLIDELKQDENKDCKFKILKTFFEKRRHNFNAGGYDAIFEKQVNPVVSFFSKRAICEQVKNNLLDAIIYNTDRDNKNTLYRISGNNKDISQVIHLNSGNSFENASHIATGDYMTIRQGFDNIFKREKMAEFEIINEVEKNKELEKYFTEKDRIEFAKELQENATRDFAKEIEKATNVKIDKRYQEVVLENMDTVGRFLEMGL